MPQANTAHTTQTAQPAQPTAQQPAWYAIRQRTALASAAFGSQAAQAAEPEVLIYGDIGQSWWDENVGAAQFLADISAITAPRFTVRISSNGGSVSEGIAIHNAIQRHPAWVTTVVDSVALSISSLIAMAGDEVHIAENALFMVHAPWLVSTSGNAAELRATADMLDAHAAAMSTSYAAKPASHRPTCSPC